MSPHVLVTGSGGFVGGHVVAAAGAAGGVRLRLLVRTGPPPGPGPAAGTPVTFVRGDLAEPGSLTGVCDGVDAVVHCASRVGGDPGELRRVNDLGTRALVEEARRAGVRRFVCLSTAAVHGRGPFRAVRPGEVPYAPGSATSRTRAAAEGHVLAAGGTVLRPHLVYGAGDRWVVPGVLTLLRTLGARPEGRLGRQSMVDAAALGRALLSAALAPPGHAGGVRFVNHPRPVPGADLLTAVAETYGLFPGTVPGLPLEEARARLRGHPVALHHLELLAADHWFDDAPVWDALGCSPGPSFAEGFPRYAARYRNPEPAPPRGPGRAQYTPDAALSAPSASSGAHGR
ncbi:MULTISPECIES: NAD-dependent epimerase/dehydratase family protein [unclassified Streptomyces]|uniref:NAD-dependent epimerase/dehydratase family protein n=1 Tax=unclassified Streptomyces TaxID=2593676 RepID=UPI00099ED4A9|nr:MULTISPECIES: NAD-dependent epimerase/dehydratase family protein [unclassified Streptomyces]